MPKTKIINFILIIVMLMSIFSMFTVSQTFAKEKTITIPYKNIPYTKTVKVKVKGKTKKKKKTYKLKQSGLCTDHTLYDQHDWIRKQSNIFWKWNKKRDSKYNIAKYKGYYLIAIRDTLVKVGDRVTVVLKNNKKINCLIADTKGTDIPYTKYGHVLSDNTVSVVEWEAIHEPKLPKSWKWKYVKKIINYGQFKF